ncbi:lanthionine synthetase C family protein [Nocardiopsis sediminis]|uniref:Lanthionine synthetase C family protein n=1 Tax=Nocardiopsis sediminis TaxID=1778267 RepID=A0ABV8FR20_9ACTN
MDDGRLMAGDGPYDVTRGDVDKVARETADRLAGAAGEGPAAPFLGGGDLGIALALLYAGETFDDDGHRGAARALLRRAVDATARTPLTSPGLYDGTAGFAWVLAEFARSEPRYLPALDRLLARLEEQVSALPPPDGGGAASRDYDAISGAAGALAAVLKAGEVAGGRDTLAHTLVGRLLDYTATGADAVPHWYSPPALHPAAAPWYRDRFPHGMYNLGFAHGLPGVLAALCAAASRGIGGSAVVARIRALSAWLAEHRIDDADGPSWPGALQARPGTRLPDSGAPMPPARTAWCYGAPGVAAALLSAAAVTGDTAPRDLAVAALERVDRTPEAEQQAFAPTLCHGRAGLLACYRRAHTATGLPTLRRMADSALAEVYAQASREHPYVFADQPRPGSLAHTPGLLEGAAGVLLALLGEPGTPAARWDDVLFLTPNEMAAP